MEAADLPQGRPVTDDELAIYVADAILNDRMNPGHNLPFTPHWNEVLARLGIGRANEREAMQSFLAANREEQSGFRLAEFCWRMVGLGFLVPRMNNDWGSFQVTSRGRNFLAGLDPAVLTPGGLDGRLAELGLERDAPARLYARLAQDCFLAGHYTASVAMLGSAVESVIDELAEVLSARRGVFEPSLKPRIGRPTARQDLEWVSEALKDRRAPILKAVTDAGGTGDWFDELASTLTGTGQSVRLTRNEAGHPTGFVAEQPDALQLLTLYPRLARVSYSGLAELRLLPTG